VYARWYLWNLHLYFLDYWRDFI